MSTNAEIILKQRVDLMKAGALDADASGEVVEVVWTDTEGNEQTETTRMPEQIHTFAQWKRLGYRVRKGEHAIASFSIWMPSKRKAAENEETDDEDGRVMNGRRFFLKKAHFFKASQVERIEETEQAA